MGFVRQPGDIERMAARAGVPTAVRQLARVRVHYRHEPTDGAEITDVDSISELRKLSHEIRHRPDVEWGAPTLPRTF
jgi:hypothetical protein